MQVHIYVSSILQGCRYLFKTMLIEIKDIQVYGLENAIRKSGLPKIADPNTDLSGEATEKDLKRGATLGSCKPASGHDCYLKGINVQFDVLMSQAMAQQAKRYHWFDYVSSMSTMHCILTMNIAEMCNNYVSADTINMLEKMVACYNEGTLSEYVEIEHYYNIGMPLDSKEALFQAIVYNIPSGFRLRAAISTNYLQLKNIYNQRKNHKLDEWREFCEFVEGLPRFKELVFNL